MRCRHCGSPLQLVGPSPSRGGYWWGGVYQGTSVNRRTCNSGLYGQRHEPDLSPTAVRRMLRQP